MIKSILYRKYISNVTAITSIFYNLFFDILFSILWFSIIFQCKTVDIFLIFWHSVFYILRFVDFPSIRLLPSGFEKCSILIGQALSIALFSKSILKDCKQNLSLKKISKRKKHLTSTKPKPVHLQCHF